MSIVADRLQRVKPSPTIAVTMKAAELKAAGKDVIGLGRASPISTRRANIKAAAKAAIDKGDTKYTAVDGTAALKKAVQAKFKRENDLDYAPNQISVGTGGKQVLYNALMATLNPGDEVIIPAPYWVSYPDMVILADGKPVEVACSENQGFKLTPGSFGRRDHAEDQVADAQLAVEPDRGRLYARGSAALADVLLKHRMSWIMTDDMYEHLVYDDFEFTTIAQVEPSSMSVR